MSGAPRRVMMVALLILTPVAGAAEEGHRPPGKQEQVEEAKRLGQQVEKLDEAGKYAEAVSLAERQLRILEAVLGKNHPDVATSLNDLGSLHCALGAYQKAEPLFVRSLQIREATLGKN